MRALTNRVKLVMCAGACLSLITTGAVAHPGHIIPLHENLFMTGFMHPLTGLDHLLALIAVGLWSALSHTSVRQAVLAPAVFFIMLSVGAMLGAAGLHIPMVEPMIMASLLVLGLLVASPRVVHGAVGYVVVGVFAVFHGLAHGMEFASSDGAAAFLAGFMLATLALHMVGLFGGFQLKRYSAWLSRVLGGGIAAYGLLLIAGISGM